MRKRWISGLAVLALSGAVAIATPSYTAVFLPTAGFTDVYATGISSNGQIVGYSRQAGVALLWSTPYSSPVVLPASGYLSAVALATDGTVNAGYAITPTGNNAVLWDNNGNLTDLAQTGYVTTAIYGVSGGQEVGDGATSNGANQALLWNGSDPNAINLNPAGYSISNANGTNGIYQVGAATPSPVNGIPQDSRAIIWSGTANSAQNITPAGYIDAYASGISGNLVVGAGSPGEGKYDALLWNLSTDTVTDLEPTNLTGFDQSEAFAVAGQYEAGYANSTTAASQAMIWMGSAASAVDLQGYLPLSYAFSEALGVDADGDVVGYAGAYGQHQAVIWLAPEPCSLLSAAWGLLFFRIGHRRR